MRKCLGVLIVASVFALTGAGLQAIAEFPSWAYGQLMPPPPPGTPPAAPAAPAGGGRQRGAAPATPAAQDPTVYTVPGSSVQYTRAQLGNQYAPPDWFPGDHPAMPPIVARGDMARTIAACSLCHMPNGKGRPENAPVTGLPVEYFIKTMMDFKNDLRKSADPRKANAVRMAGFAKAMTDEEIRQAAEYFGAMPWTQWIRVVEIASVPKTRIQGGMFLRLEGTETEPIGNRIIETPENTERTEIMRDPRSGFIAYVPVGSVKKGETLVTSGGNGRTVACATCHGADLRGMGPVPGIAGRSPSYTVRQLHDMQTGARKGSWAELMSQVVTKLTAEDLVAVAAYVASRPAPAAPGTQTAAR